jgi:hypothetical protein
MSIFILTEYNAAFQNEFYRKLCSLGPVMTAIVGESWTRKSGDR